ncbi:integumentary mucin B.1 [Cetorhinus maximus]
MLIHGEKLYPLSEGCFCPKGMMLSENKTTCVRSCCIDNSGTPRNEGETWSHPTNPCTSYECNKSQVITSEVACPCKAGRYWDTDNCSNWCRKQYGPCSMLSISKTVTMKNSSCSAEVMMARCEGSCPGWSEFDTVTNTMINECGCCQPVTTENRTVELDCGNGGSVPYTYPYITSCECIGSTCYNQ